jgi:hypothetical protein
MVAQGRDVNAGLEGSGKDRLPFLGFDGFVINGNLDRHWFFPRRKSSISKE